MSGPEYALRLREVEEENAKLRAERDRLLAEVMAPCDCPAHLERKRTEEARAESSRLSREVEGLKRAIFWSAGWRQYRAMWGRGPDDRNHRRNRKAQARLRDALSGGGDASAEKGTT